jgi:hypothetical protein
MNETYTSEMHPEPDYTSLSDVRGKQIVGALYEMHDITKKGDNKAQGGPGTEKNVTEKQKKSGYQVEKKAKEPATDRRRTIHGPYIVEDGKDD